jgi:hypothetical protein
MLGRVVLQQHAAHPVADHLVNVSGVDATVPGDDRDLRRRPDGRVRLAPRQEREVADARVIVARALALERNPPNVPRDPVRRRDLSGDGERDGQGFASGTAASAAPSGSIFLRNASHC